MKLIPVLTFFSPKKVSSKIGAGAIRALTGIGSRNETPILRVDSQYVDGVMRDEVDWRGMAILIDSGDGSGEQVPSSG
ncbi:MAG: hypothetical protein IPJ84_04595 [Bdellovibrionales bacterium]|nr:hypothetical protein [Bdellovibrionales bacterium]